MVIVIIKMMIVMTSMIEIIEIGSWRQVRNQKCRNKFICSHTFDCDLSSDSLAVIVVIVTVAAIIIHLHINTL